MRIFHALAGAPQGGAELFVERFCLALQRHGIDQRVAIRRDAARAARLRAGGIEPIELAFGGPLDLATRPALRRSIAAFGADLVISYMSRATKHCPRGDFVHVGRLGGYYGLKYYRHCDHLVAVTPDVGRHVVDAGWPADACSVIHNFVDDRPAQALERRIHATPDAAPLIVALGRLHTNKAFDTLLRALAALPGVYLWLAGEGPEHRALESLARQLGIADRIRLLGWQTDPGPVFAAADVVVVPSRHEPLGNVMIEAWMHAKPVVATASQGPSYLLTHGETGLLSPIDDAPALARGIAEVLADPALADRLARGGRAKFERDFTERAVIGRYLDLFTRLIARRRK